MGTLTTADGTRLYYKDWGVGRPVLFCHGWPLSSDSWEGQMMFLANHGYRCVAHDRRGHGRSSQPWEGNDMDRYADDLAELIDTLDLRDLTLVGFSAGGGEVARYLGRHGGERVKRVVLISSVPPLLLQTAANPEGVPQARYDANRLASLIDRAQLYRDIAAGPFFGANRPGAKVSQGVMDSFWRQGMLAGLKNTHDCIKAFSETDFTKDLRSITQPTLLIHGDDDQIVPLEISSRRSAELIPNAKLHILLGGPHGLLDTHREQVNTLLLDFLKS